MSRGEEAAQALREALETSRRELRSYDENDLRAPSPRANLGTLQKAVGEGLTAASEIFQDADEAREKGRQAGIAEASACDESFAAQIREKEACAHAKELHKAAEEAFAAGVQAGRKAQAQQSLPFTRPSSFDIEDKARKIRIFIRVQDSEG
jgi:hypothetical protein